MEEWRNVIGYEGLYLASNLGNIKSIKKNLILSSNKLDKDGYVVVKLSKNGIKTLYFEHRIVCIAFWDNTENKKTVNHKDFDKRNNSINNLEWATDKEQALHRHSKGGNTYNPNKCIYFSLRVNKWIAYATIDNKSKHIGHYIFRSDAVKARKKFLATF